jgi:flagellar biosynthesis protein FlhF
MKLKSYFSATVEAAVELARKELGEDALLVNARPSTPDTRHLGAYEVVFGSNARSAGATPMHLTAASVRAGAISRETTPDRLSEDVAQMKREIERLAQSLRGAHAYMSPASPNADAGNAEFYSRLVENELDAPIAQQVAQGAPLESFFEVDATPGRAGASRAVVALVGPPGAGKTTTLIKLAARFGLTSRKPALIITTDVFRIAAADQLRSLASILGIACEVAETPAALAQALEEHRSKEFVFIDTPGLANGEMDDGADLARLIATHPEIDTHMVLSASMKPVDMARTIDRYAIFQARKLLFTRTDETESYGALISTSSRRGMPISFLGTGQQIPDDLEPATKARLIEMVTGHASTNRKAGAVAA